MGIEAKSFMEEFENLYIRYQQGEFPFLDSFFRKQRFILYELETSDKGSFTQKHELILKILIDQGFEDGFQSRVPEEHKLLQEELQIIQETLRLLIN
ncbi:MAG: hypothetical protein MK105_12540 [Crocinitomicaceae bacterium]|nr:hypothetical protein [Crocinitomicaceae bacterium]